MLNLATIKENHRDQMPAGNAGFLKLPAVAYPIVGGKQVGKAESDGFGEIRLGGAGLMDLDDGGGDMSQLQFQRGEVVLLQDVEDLASQLFVQLIHALVPVLPIVQSIIQLHLFPDLL